MRAAVRASRRRHAGRRGLGATAVCVGTYIHGLFADDRQRGAWLARLGAGPATVAYDELVESTLDRLAEHLDAPSSISTGCSA